MTPHLDSITLALTLSSTFTWIIEVGNAKTMASSNTGFIQPDKFDQKTDPEEEKEERITQGIIVLSTTLDI